MTGTISTMSLETSRTSTTRRRGCWNSEARRACHPNVNAADLPIRRPCPVEWDTMVPGSTGVPQRYCGTCDTHVHDLSAMTEPEVRALLARGRGICVRFRYDAAGVVRTREPLPRRGSAGAQGRPDVPATALRTRRRAAGTLLLSTALAACAPHGSTEPRHDALECADEDPSRLAAPPRIPSEPGRDSVARPSESSGEGSTPDHVPDDDRDGGRLDRTAAAPPTARLDRARPTPERSKGIKNATERELLGFLL
jgi:hypothetical protein